MRVLLSPRRRNAAALGGATAAMAASLNLAHHSSGSPDRFYTVLGIVTGIMVGFSIILWRKRSGRSACSN